MDTQTVLKIIEMLDARLQVIEDSSTHNSDEERWFYTGELVGKDKALQEFRNHLQKYIHSLQNQVENDLSGEQ